MRKKAADLGNGNNRRRLPAQDLRDILYRIVSSCSNPSLLIELHYWSYETELIDFVRHFLGLPEEVQQGLRSFLAVSKDDPVSVTATSRRRGQLTLASPVAEEVKSVDEPVADSTH
jgi:hypothetical protein